MTSRLRIGVLKGRPAAMIFAILCAVIVFAGGPTKALATTNFIVKATTHEGTEHCDDFFNQLLMGNLVQEELCESDEPECHRRLSSSENIYIQQVRNMKDFIIGEIPRFNNMEVEIAAGVNCSIL